jgi:hypothetical protein
VLEAIYPMKTPVSFVSTAWFAFCGAALLVSLARAQEPEIRVGLIGLDTSHVIAFTGILNDPKNKEHVPGARVVAAFKGGSSDVESSASRVDGYTNQLATKYGVKLYDTIEELAANVDAIMIESVDGRPHLDQARRAFQAHKPVFIDKPLAGSLRDGIEIVRLAQEQKVPLFSASSLRYAKFVVAVKNTDVGKQLGAFSIGPAPIEPHHPDMFYYGIHATEMLFTALGRGCVSVVRTNTPDTDVITGVWSDGRVGTVRGARNAKTEYELLVFGAKGIAQDKQNAGGYGPLLVEIVKFFKTGVSPVDPAETVELLAFMEAADESKRRGGVPVLIADVMTPNRSALVKGKP